MHPIKSSMKYASYVATFFALALIVVNTSCNGPSTTTLLGSWDKIGDFPGFPRSGAVYFVINDTVYVGTGFNYQLSSNSTSLGFNNAFGRLSDFWKYDPSIDSWVQKASLGDSIGTGPGTGAGKVAAGGFARSNAVGFSIGNYGYVGTGSPDGGTTLLSDFWQFDPTAGKWGKWTRIAPFAGGYAAQPLAPRYSALAFTIQGRGFVGGGTTFGKMNLKDFWEFVPGDGSFLSGTWVQQPDIGGSKRANAFVMIIDDFAYVGGGSDNGQFVTDFFKFDVSKLEGGAQSPWIAVNGLTGKDVNGNAITQPRPRELASAFAIDHYGYLTCGSTGGPNSDTWQYDPSTDTWIQYFSFSTNQPIPGASRMGALGFAVTTPSGTYGYLTTGESARTYQYDDAWKFNPTGVEQDNK